MCNRLLIVELPEESVIFQPYLKGFFSFLILKI